MEQHIRLKVKNYGPLVSGTTALDGGWLEVPRLLVLIGDQGSGKSTVAKLFSSFAWLEKAFVRRYYDAGCFDMDSLATLLGNQNLSKGYLHDDTELSYDGAAYRFSVTHGRFLAEEKQGAAYRSPQIMYFPSERNILSVVDNPWEVKGMPPMTGQLANEFLRASRSAGASKRELFGNYRIEFVPETRTNFISDPSGASRIPLSQASSGLQSMAPLLVVSDHLSRTIKEDFLERLKQENVSIKELALQAVSNGLQAKLSTFFASGLENTFTEEDRKELQHRLEKYVNSCLWEIVEEPEQNLYPTSQRQLVMKLAGGMDAEGKLVLTTHSPYVLAVLNNLIVAADVHAKNGKDIPGIPEGAMIGFDEVRAYKLEDGGLKDILDPSSGMIDATEIDECSREINEEFDRLMDLE